jgi:rod shape-determining protein MreD
MKPPWWTAPTLLFLAAVFQASLLPALGLIRARPELVLVAVVIWAVLRGVREALPLAFGGGLLLDLFSQAPLGTASLALLLVALCASVGEASIFRTSFLLPTIIVFWAGVLYGLVYLFLLRTHQVPVEWLGTLRHSVVPSAIMSAACAPAVYWVLSRVERATRVVKPVEW